MKHITLSLFSALAIAIPAQAQEVYDATIISHVGIKYVCDGEFQPVLRIQNTGTVAMTSCVVDIWKNGIPASSFDWQLAVAAQPGDIRQPVLPVVTDVVVGDVLTFYIISVNEEPDEVEEGNTWDVSLSDEPVVADTYIAYLEVQTSDAPLGTSWVVYDAFAQIVAQGGPYLEAQTTYEQWMELAPGTCHALLVTDPNNEAGVDIEVRLFSSGVVVIDEVIAAGDVLDLGFITGTSVGMQETSRSTGLKLLPNPTTGLLRVEISEVTDMPVLVELLDASGRLVHTARPVMAGGTGFTLDMGGWPTGLYLLRMRLPDGTTMHDRVMLQY